MPALSTLIVNWIDLIWLPIACAVATPRQRPWAIAFMILCAISMRLQIDLIHSTGFKSGFTQFFTGDVKLRATLIYGIFCALYLLMLHYSPRSPWPVLLSASIVVYVAAFCISLAFMAV